MTRNILLAAALGVGGLLAAGAVLADTQMLPGYYETKTREAGDSEVETTRDCVRANEKRSIEQALNEQLNNASCKYTQRTIGGGKFAIAGSCVEQGVKSSFKQTGTYTTSGFTLNMSLALSMGGQSVKVDTVSTSRRISATCPAGAR